MDPQRSKPDDARETRSKRRKTIRKPGRARPRPETRLAVGQWVHVDGGASPVEIIELDGWRAMVAFGNMRMQVNVERLTPAQKSPSVSKGRMVTGAPQISLDIRGYRTADAVAAVEKLIDQGVRAGLSAVEIVHGIGTGALRAAVHTYLDGVDHVKAYESPGANPGLTRASLA